MIVFSVASAKKMLGLSRKEIRKALHSLNVISWSWDIENDGKTGDLRQLVVIRHKQVMENAISTSILITEDGISAIKSYYNGTI